MSKQHDDVATAGEADSVIVAATDPDREIDQELVDELLAQAGEAVSCWARTACCPS